MTGATRPTVLIYRSHILPISETFIRQHYDGMTRYRPVFAGLRAVAGLPVGDTCPILLERDGRRRSAKLAAFKLLGIAPEFRRAIAAQSPALIHAHFAVDAVDMLPIARALDIPLVVTLHGYDVTLTDAAFGKLGAQGLYFLARRKKLFSQADRFLAVSKFIAGRARVLGVPKARTQVHYLGIDLNKIGQFAGPRDKAVLYVGRLVEKKGLNLLIEAMARAGANKSGTILRVIGDGPMRDIFLAQARDKLENFEYFGEQPHDRVMVELKRAGVFCLPSIPSANGDSEGLPISIMEASAAGLPVVAFAHGGLLEAVKDGETGLLAPTGNTDALAAHLARLLGAPDLRAMMGARGRRYVQKIFDGRVCSARLEEIYDTVIAARRNA